MKQSNPAKINEIKAKIEGTNSTANHIAPISLAQQRMDLQDNYKQMVAEASDLLSAENNGTLDPVDARKQFNALQARDKEATATVRKMHAQIAEWKRKDMLDASK